MIFKLFARKSDVDVVERLYAAIMAAARRPALYQGRYSIPDTLEGRFDALILHSYLVSRRLAALPEPAPRLAQDLTDRVFFGFDRALREMGVGDLAVPKRMKKLGADYAGRCAAYEAALGQGEAALAEALARNVYGKAEASVAAPLARYVLNAEAVLAATPYSTFERGEAPLPEPTEAA